MADRRPARLAALRDAIAAAHLDGLLVSSLPSIRYLTGFSGSNALVAITARDIALITDFRYATQVVEEVGQMARVSIEPQSLWTGLWRVLPQMPGAEVMGFESAHVMHRDFARLLDSGSQWQWRPVSELVETLRERKDDDEIALIAQAADVATRALERTVPELAAGMTETAVAGVLERALRDEGSEAYPFDSIIASGPRSALPHARSSSRVIGKGDFLLIDFGAIVGGYCSDVTRTFVVGRASAEQREVYDVVCGANEHASANVRAGMTGRDADALARRYIEGRGMGDLFGHSLGHGIGLEVHEAPRLSTASESVLPVGATVTIEPGVYRPEWGGVRVEDDVVLSAEGARVLTSFPRQLIEI